MPINRWMDKQLVVYTHNGLLFSNKREGTINTYNNMGEFKNIMLKPWKKPETKEYIVCDSVYINFQKTVN